MPVRPDPDLLQQWVIRDGVPAAQVGARLGLSRAAGYSWLRRYGITPAGPVVAQRRLIAEWRAGAPARLLATKFRLPAEAVRERLSTTSGSDGTRRYFVVGSPDDPLPEDLLRQWYVREGFSAEQVAVLTDTTARQVRYRLARYRLSRGAATRT